MDSHYTTIRLAVSSILVISAMLSLATADTNKDREECAQQLVGLATCLPYVGGDAKTPTPDCCSGLKQVLKSDKKCLCVVIRDRNDPELGLKINVTLALGLPSVCHAPANVSQCPALLHLPPNSPDAQVFYQSGNNSSINRSASGAPALSPSPIGSFNQAPSAPQKSDGGYINHGKRYIGWEIVVCVGISFWWAI